MHCYANFKKATKGKREATRSLIKKLKPFFSKEHLRMLSLPSKTWKTERDICRELDKEITVDAIERNQMVYLQMIEKAKAFNNPKMGMAFCTDMLSYIKGASLRHINGLPIKYDIVYLDWMGTIDGDKSNQCKSLFKHGLLSNKVVLLFVFSTRRGWGPAINMLKPILRVHRASSIVNNNFRTCGEKNRVKGFIALINKIAEENNYKVGGIGVKKYLGQGSWPMAMIGFSLKKK